MLVPYSPYLQIECKHRHSKQKEVLLPNLIQYDDSISLVCLFLVVSSIIKRLCHSSYDHPWEYTKFYRLLKLVCSHEHHVHHLYPNKNFPDLFIFWDQLFRTFLDPKDVDGIYNYDNIKMK